MLAACCASVLPASLAAAVAPMVKDMQKGTGRQQQEGQDAERVRAMLRDEKVSRDRDESEERDP